MAKSFQEFLARKTYSGHARKKALEQQIGLDTYSADLTALSDAMKEGGSAFGSVEGFDGARQSVESLLARTKALQEYTKLYGGNDTGLADTAAWLTDRQAYLGKFADFADYQGQKAEYERLSQNYDFAATQARINALKKQKEDIDGRKYALDLLTPDELYKSSEHESIETLEKEIAKLEKEMRTARVYQAANAASLPDFEEKSKPITTNPNGFQPGWENGEPVDWLHEYINSGFSKDIGQYAQFGNVDDLVYYVHLMNADEIKGYNYLRNDQGEEASRQYLDGLYDTLYSRFLGEQADYGKEHPFLGTMHSLVLGIASPFEEVAAQLAGMQDAPNVTADLSQAMQSGVASNIESDLGQFFYNTGISALQSVAAGMLFGKAGGAILGLSAMASTRNDLLRRGADAATATKAGLAAGVFECLFESLSLGQLTVMKEVPVNSFKDLVLNIAKSMGVNASEEAATEVANILYDTFANGDFSEAQQMLDAGMSKGEIAKKFGLQIAEAAASGAVMGLGFGALGSGVSGATNAVNASRIGKAIKGGETTFGSVSGLTELGDKYGIKQTAMVKAKGTKASNRAVGDLYRRVSAAVAHENQSTTKAAIEKRLAELGTDKAKVGKLADAVLKKYMRQSLSFRESAMLDKSKAARQALSEMLENSNSKWVNDLRATLMGEASRDISTISDKDVSAAAEQAAEIARSEGPEVQAANGESLGSLPKIASLGVNGVSLAAPSGEVALDEAAMPEDKALLYTLAGLLPSAEIANDFVQAWDGATDPSAYFNAYQMIYTYGRHHAGYTDAAIAEAGKKSGLSEAQISAAFKSGVQSLAEERRMERERLDGIIQRFREGGANRPEGKWDATGLRGVDLKKVAKENLGLQDVEQLVAFLRMTTKAFGWNVRVIADKSDKRSNGGYDPSTNTLTFNIYAGTKAGTEIVRTAMPNTISHETVHWMKRNAPEQYQALEDMVLAALKNANDYDFGAAVKKEYGKYKEKHGQDIDDPTAREEIVARACEDLFGRSEAIQQFLADLAEKNKEAATGVTAAVKKVLAKIKAFFENLIFGHSSRTLEAGIVRKCGVDVVQGLQEQYEKTFFAALEGNAARNALGEFEQGGMRYSFAGEHAKTADKMKLATAQQMIADGADSETVRRETGWYQGYDGKWRFEISDLESFLIENPDLEKHTDDGETYFIGKLANILDHEDLFAAYPDMKDINIVIQKTDFGVDGIYQPRSNYITLSIEQFKRYTKAYSDHLNGGRKAEIAEIEASEAYKEYNRFYDDEVVDAMEPTAWLEAEEATRDKFFSSDLGKRYYQLMWGKENGFSGDKFELGWGKAAKAVLLHELQHAVQNREGFASGTNTRDTNYDRNAGEIEARDVANRAELTAEQRKNTRPDIDRSDVVFADSDLSLSIGEAKDGTPVVVVNDDITKYASDDAGLVKLVKERMAKLPYVVLGKQQIRFTRDTKKEVTYSNHTKWLRKNAPEIYKDKMRSFNHPNEIILATTNYINEGLHHPRKDDIIDFARGEVLLDVLGKKYLAEVVIGFTQKGVCELHDLMNMKPVTFEYKKRDALSTISSNDEHLQKRSSLNNSISQNLEMSTPSAQENSGNGTTGLKSDPEDDVKSDREILAGALMSVAQNEIERNALKVYQGYAKKLDEMNARLREVNAELRTMMFQKGARDEAYTKQLDELKAEKDKLEKGIARWDSKLFALEVTKSLQDLLDREKQRTAKLWIDAGRKAMNNYREKQLCRVYTQKIEEKAKNLRKMLLENSEKYHIPDAFKKPVAAFLSLLDFSSERALQGGELTKKDMELQAAFAEVVTLLESLTDENSNEYLNGLDLPPDAVDAFVSLSKEVAQMAIDGREGDTMVLRRMSSEQLKTLNTTLYAMTRAVRQANDLFANERFRHVSEIALDFIGNSEQYAAREQRSKISDFLSWENMVPYYAFRRLGAAGEALFKGFMQGQDKFAFLVKDIIDFTDTLYTKKEVKEWSRQVHTFDGTNGKVYITTAQIMSLYELWKDKDARQHILGGGGRIQDISFGINKKYTNDPNGTALGELVVDAMFAKLTPRQKAVADSLQKFMAEECAKWGNEVSYKRWGIRIFGLDYYFPIESDKNTVAADVEQRAKESGLFSLLHKSFTKKRVFNANNRIMIRSVFDVFASHTTDMAKYHAFALPLLDMQKFINFKEIVTKEQAAAEAYQAAVEEWDGEDKGGYFALGDTSDALAKIGVPKNKIYFDQSKAKKSMADHPEVTKGVLKGIPELLQNPIVVAESYDNTVLIYGELYDDAGHPVMVALRMDCNSRANDGTTVNKIRSVGVRMRSMDKYLADQNILYLDEDKKRTDTWFQALGRSTPFGGTKYGPIRSIPHSGQNVNTVSNAGVGISTNDEQKDTSFTTKEVRASMEKAFGTAAYKYIEQFLIDLNGNIGGRSAAESILQKGITLHKIAAVGANLRVALLQPTAYMRLLNVMEPKYFFGGLTAGGHLKACIEKMQKYSGIALWKSLGYRDTNIATPIQTKIKHDETWRDKVTEKSMILAELGDKVTWGAIWYACELETRGKRADLKVGSEEYYRAVAERFTEIIYATQVVDSTFTKSQIMRKKDFFSTLFTSFMSEPTLSYNLLASNALSLMDAKRRGGKVAWAAAKPLMRAIGTFAIGALLQAAVESMIDAARAGADDDEPYGERYWEEFLANTIQEIVPLNLIPVVKDIWSIALSTIKGDYMQSSRMDLEVYHRIARAVKATVKMFEDGEAGYAAIYKILTAVSSMTGLPISNLMRDVQAIWNTIIGDMIGGPKWKSK